MILFAPIEKVPLPVLIPGLTTSLLTLALALLLSSPNLIGLDDSGCTNRKKSPYLASSLALAASLLPAAAGLTTGLLTLALALRLLALLLTFASGACGNKGQQLKSTICNKKPLICCAAKFRITDNGTSSKSETHT
jgi:hypothetical protein